MSVKIKFLSFEQQVGTSTGSGSLFYLPTSLGGGRGGGFTHNHPHKHTSTHSHTHTFKNTIDYF